VAAWPARPHSADVPICRHGYDASCPGEIVIMPASPLTSLRARLAYPRY